MLQHCVREWIEIPASLYEYEELVSSVFECQGVTWKWDVCHFSVFLLLVQWFPLLCFCGIFKLWLKYTFVNMSFCKITMMFLKMLILDDVCIYMVFPGIKWRGVLTFSWMFRSCPVSWLFKVDTNVCFAGFCFWSIIEVTGKFCTQMSSRTANLWDAALGPTSKAAESAVLEVTALLSVKAGSLSDDLKPNAVGSQGWKFIFQGFVG